jgi:uncharacterized protein (TIGR02453 family)
VDGLSGFASGAFEFFRELAQNNNQQWFNHNRERYDYYVVGSFRALLQELAPFLPQFNPHFKTSGKTNRNFSRINRDIRFSKDKSPYKSNFYLYVFDCQREPQADGRLYVGPSADCLTVSCSVYASWKAGRKSVLESIFRPRVKVHPELWQNLLDRVVRRGRYETYWYGTTTVAGRSTLACRAARRTAVARFSFGLPGLSESKCVCSLPSST